MAKGGSMSMSNGYDVHFELPGTLKEYLSTYLLDDVVTANGTNTGGLVKLFCDEAQLPNVQSATGQLQGRYLGESQINYPYAKFFTDFGLSWMCDVNMTPLKFVTAWHHYIFGGMENDGPIVEGSHTGSLNDIKKATPNEFNRPIRLNYPAEYCAKLKISKTDQGPAAPNQRSGIMYILEDVYPYSIDTVPLSYGSSQITKVSANFYYAKHSVVYQDQTWMDSGISLNDASIKDKIQVPIG